MNSVRINDNMYKSIRTVTVKNGKVSVDGITVDPGESKNGILEIKVEGVLENLTADGSVNCDDVQGTVQAGGSVNCDNIGGDVQCGGSITCDNVAGSVMAGGSIMHG